MGGPMAAAFSGARCCSPCIGVIGVVVVATTGSVPSGATPRRGQSLVVWAIREGRQAAHAVDKFLMGSTLLPR